MANAQEVRHGLSFDIECYYQIISKDYLQTHTEPTPEVEYTTSYLLDLLRDLGVQATFFVLGNVARKYPALVRRITDEGHELGVHGDEHLYIFNLHPGTFREELRSAIDALEQVAGCKIRGHRAPAFSVVRETLWATDVMRELGLEYDSSIFPIQGSRYGIPDAPLTPYVLDNGLVEIPMTAIEVGQRRLPAVGGGYFRVFPYQYTRWAMQRCEKEGRSAITYFHPHEFALERPKVPKTAWLRSPRKALKLAKFGAAQGVGRGERMRERLEKLIQEHRFGPIYKLAEEVRA